MTQRKKHNQEIFFDNGTRRTVKDVVYIERATWWHLFTEDGAEYIINPDRVLFVRITS